MDTTFWGPSGHQLFHSITFQFDRLPEIDKRELGPALCHFFKSVGHVLPCIYCRRSFQQYYKQFPLRNHLDNTFAWYYRIHNLINDKLRRQGYLHSTDPSLARVKRYYTQYLHKRRCFIGWDFLYSVVYHLPTHIAEELSARRRDAYLTFFNLLAIFYPIDSIRARYRVYLEDHPIESFFTGFQNMTKWLYKFEHFINTKCCTFQKKCARLDKYKVKKCANKSCRK